MKVGMGNIMSRQPLPSLYLRDKPYRGASCPAFEKLLLERKTPQAWCRTPPILRQERKVGSH